MVRFAFQVVKNQHTPNIICTFDNSRYIFNIPDGFQRFVKDHNIKINPGPLIFFTRLSTKTMCGSLGYLHTLLAQSCGVNTKMYGPKGLYNFFNMKRYNEIGGFKILPYSFQEINGKLLLGTKDTKLIDELLQQNDCLLQEFLEKIKEHEIDPKESNNAAIFMKSSTLFQDQNLQIQAVETNHSIQYIIQCPGQLGNISKEKLQQFKVPNNKMQELIKKGSIEIEGQVVTIQDVREPDIIPQSAIILDIQNQEEMNIFVNSKEFLQLLEAHNKKENNLSAILHLSHNIQDDFYLEFIQSTSQTNHILCNYEQAITSQQIEVHSKIQPVCEIMSNILHQFYPEQFPHIDQIKLLKVPEKLLGKQNILGYVPLFEYQVCPIKQVGYKPIQNLNPKNFDQIIQGLGKEQILFQKQQQDYLKLIFLGTCSMKPGQYRNVSGIIVANEKNNSHIILDCGEGTLKQIDDESIQLENKPLIIWISHAHSDHHLGMLTVLDRLRNTNKQIFLIVPAILVPWLTCYQQIFGENFKQKIIVSQQLDANFTDDVDELIKKAFHQCRIRRGEQVQIEQLQDYHQNLVYLKKKAINLDFGLNNIQVTPVEHCPQAYGIRLDFEDGRSISYSGDTRPCQQFVKLSQNVDVLIHEATFTDDLIENALVNMHSTQSEAIKIGEESNAKTIALTHYSQRYSKQIEIKQEHLDNQKVVFSCDHFGGYLNQYQELSKLSKQIIQLFNE